MKSKIFWLWAGFMLLTLPVLAQQDLMQDTWVATDAIGRHMPTAKEIGPRPEKRRFVGMFYVTWHSSAYDRVYSGPYDRDVTKILDAHPEARLRDDLYWPDGKDLPAYNYDSYHWGEPEYGYFISQDRYVIRHDISMLADAGVDVLILDATNGYLYWDEWDAVFDELETMKQAGNPVPQVCFWAFNCDVITVTQKIFERYYQPGLYRDLWFLWDGKPLFLANSHPGKDAAGKVYPNVNPHYDPKAATDPSHPHYCDPDYAKEFYEDYTAEVKDFFTMRNMWWGYYEWFGERYIGTEDNWCFGYQMNSPTIGAMKPWQRASTHNGVLEEMAVTPAQHSSSMTGKCWRPWIGEPELNDRDLPVRTYVPWLGKSVENPQIYGIYYQERWDEALEVDPDFIYLNDWNEWIALKFSKNHMDDSVRPIMPQDFSFLGRDDNQFIFVDQYNEEFNRTLQPAKAPSSDNYYMQTVLNIRKYKGVRPIPVNKGLRKIRIDGRFDDWKDVEVKYYDTRGDVIHRDSPGYGRLHYKDSSGRNDIVESRVAVGPRDVFFYAKADGQLTPSTDNNWMLLLIDADKDAGTGWSGYDYLVNYCIKDGKTTTLMKYDADTGKWTRVAMIPYRSGNSELELRIPLKRIGMSAGDALSFDFKWSDNPSGLDDIITVCISGDTAPNRRFNYRFIWEKNDD